LHWAPNKQWTFSASANWQEVYSVPETTRTNVLVSPQWAGYSPAQVYGGLIKTTIPATPYYQPLPGLPHTVENVFATYNFGHGLGFNVNVTHYSQFSASIVHDVTLPAATPVSAGVGYAYKRWSFLLSGRNLFNELYFQSNAATAFGDMIVIPTPGRTWELKVSSKF
jgi:outer membrane receptor protein involved in Fe transport